MKSKFLLLSLMSVLISGCSEQSRIESERKQDIEGQKAAQKDLIDRRANELKENAQREGSESLRTLDNEQKQLELEKRAIDDEKRDIQKRTDFAKKNIDDQSAACKKVVDNNAQRAKAQLDSLKVR